MLYSTNSARSSVLATVGVVALALCPLAPGQIIYNNNFEGVVGPEWSPTTTSVTPIGARRFLGEFWGNQNVSLTLSSLPAHTQLTVSFDLFIIRSWDGTDPNGGHSDTFRVDVQGGTNLLLASFADNFGGGGPTQRQSYPGTFPTSLFAPFTGASETNTLGYEFASSGVPVSSDSVYRVSITFAHTADGVTLNFSSDLDQASWDESWGIDNVVVSASNQVVEACTVDQICPCDGPSTGGTWANHRDYVDCVKATASAFVKARILTRSESDALTKQASQSDCGR